MLNSHSLETDYLQMWSFLFGIGKQVVTRREMSVRSVPDGTPMRFKGRALGEGMCWDPPPSFLSKAASHTQSWASKFVC